MQFQSTRDSALRVSSSEAIVRGLAPKSGLFVPESFPKADLENWKSLPYPALAEQVLKGFLTDYSADFLHSATGRPPTVRRSAAMQARPSRSATASTRWNCGMAPPARQD